MIANVTMPDLSKQRLSLPKAILIDDEEIKRVYVGRRTGRVVVEDRYGRFYMRQHRDGDWLLSIPSVRAAIDAVKEPRPL